MAVRISTDNVTKIMDGDAVLLVDEAKRIGKQLADDKLTKSQIRGPFATVREIQASWVKKPDEAQARQQLRKVLLLKPRLAYQARRDRDGKLGPLADTLTDAIDQIAGATSEAQRTERFDYFVDLFVAILAYHTAFGGK